ncbi:hypothetical protein BMT55_03240 [Listeria newyorkensis]|uniref:Lipoprotein n=1 Tax=Listeria newyorkensis TaxID=1497681 RepID=A0ABX4XVR8_9LIST|nr:MULTISPECIES: hypothetical protein [Listeria]KGL41350.1 hypothetical protein EP56_12280 [Listeriaceae bacterium FSL A5-0209]KGL44686.1 hypothetical protein EP58_04210 [Listeria newyorkensis]PNP93800.1 hypothetical protein BMT55_03240 [Listeria newyorkensis]RQW67301.1 hypothetical protein DUK53_05955 [Listeria sp. SHR_NRA_18]WAO22421.1 hypothetical protein OTR81_03880 [Listeria newyorkensis]
MKKIALIVLSLFLLTSCGMVPSNDEQIQKTTPKITLKSSPGTEIKPSRTDYSWNGEQTKAYFPAPEDFLNSKKLVQTDNTDKVQITIQQKVKTGILKASHLNSITLEMVPKSGDDFLQVDVKKLEDGTWQYNVPSEFGKYMYILKELYDGDGYEDGYYVTYYFGLEVTE